MQAITTATLTYTPPGAASAVAIALNVTSNYIAQEEGTFDIPDATPAATVFSIPFGTINVDAQALILKNTNSQDMSIRINGSANIFRLAPSGQIMVSHTIAASGGGPTPILSCDIVTTAIQSGAGTFNYFVFGV